MSVAEMRLACIHSESATARAGYRDFASRHDLVAPDQCDVLVALGGDGLLLHTLHRYHRLGVPVFGMNRGTVGFLMNEYSAEGLARRIREAKRISMHPLRMRAILPDGSVQEAMAFNEVAVTRHSGQSVNLRLRIDDRERLARFVGDGMLVATPAGSTAYNLSAHGPIVPLGSPLLALTPVSPFRPRRWRGALLPDDSVINMENLDPDKRPVCATADFHEFADPVEVEVSAAGDVGVTLLFDADRSLAERILAEQFAF